MRKLPLQNIITRLTIPNFSICDRLLGVISYLMAIAKLKRDDICNGTFCYNGTSVGAALATFSSEGNSNVALILLNLTNAIYQTATAYIKATFFIN